jgi:ADP-ribosylglycohydrolase/O-acetyl-ADP-ribose deacetylase (regulator of RNase III)
MRHGLVRFPRRPGDISDDTQLSICVARSIDPSGAYVHERFLDELRVWHGYQIGAGRACSLAARRLQPIGEGILKDPRGTASEGNGVAICVAPLALAHPPNADTEALRTEVQRNAAATHPSALAAGGAVMVALLIKEALIQPRMVFDPSSLERMLSSEKTFSALFPAEELRELGALAQSQTPLPELLRRRGTSGHIKQTLQAAVLTLFRHGTDFRGAMRDIFQAGGDVDSIGAIVGSIIGARLGVSGLPGEWVSVIQHRDYLLSLAERLAHPEEGKKERAGMVVEVQGDVALRPVDAIVNAWNRNLIPAWLLIPQGVSRSIRRAGGHLSIKQISRRGPLPLGSAAETSGGTLTARWVIHVAGINLLWRTSKPSIRGSTRNALSLARCLGARTVAFPLIGAGSGGMASARAHQLMRAELEREAHHFDRLELVVYQK